MKFMRGVFLWQLQFVTSSAQTPDDGLPVEYFMMQNWGAIKLVRDGGAETTGRARDENVEHLAKQFPNDGEIFRPGFKSTKFFEAILFLNWCNFD